jgi:hypothetical protein
MFATSFGGILQPRAAIGMSYDTPFQQLTPEEEDWLNRWEHEGAKELAVGALQLCIDLVLPAARQATARLTEADQRANLQRWYSVYYSGTTFKKRIDTNLMTAFELNRLSRIVGDHSAFLTAAVLFLDAAQKEYARLTANGMPDGLRPWRRLRPSSS